MSTTLLRPDTARPAPLGRLARGLADRLVGPHGLDRYLEAIDPRLATDRHTATVTDVHRETADVVTLTLRAPRGWASGRLRRPRPGQALNVIVEVDGVRHVRSFSVASLTPTRGHARSFTLTVKANPAGTVSRHLVAHAHPGLVVEVGAPFGEMVLDDAARQGQLLLVSGGSGITPVMAMLRQLRDEGGLLPHGTPAGPRTPTQVTFLHYATDADNVIFRRELHAMQGRFRNLEIVVVHTDDGASAPGALAGFLTTEHLRALAVDPTLARTFACGPTPLVRGLEASLRELAAAAPSGLPVDGRLTVEQFHPPAAPTGDAVTGGTLHLSASDQRLVDDGRSILEQAEAAGLTPASGCRMGICHTCTRHVTDGSVRNVLTGAVATATATSPVETQICISTPHGDCAVDL